MVGENHTQAAEGEGKISYHNNSVHAVWEWEPGNEVRVWQLYHHYSTVQSSLGYARASFPGFSCPVHNLGE